MSSRIRLTQTVQKSGCAAKVAASELRSILSQVKFPPKNERLLVDGGLFDDAAIYKVSDEIALVQTLDFFTPIVDEPYQFGSIAAANALSDVYAMGGVPQTAMAILGFPLDRLESHHVVDILQGASDKIKEAKANFVGGHSIDDETLKFGLSVTGFVHPDKVWSNAGARPGDILILTKALGTGTLMSAVKRDELEVGEVGDALASMAQLNNLTQLLDESDLECVHAATDITGFGVAGHGMQVAKASNVTLELKFSALPLFKKTQWALEKNILTKAHRTNREYTQEHIEISGLSAVQSQVLFDPQTSGGLLLSVQANQAASFLGKVQKHFSMARIVGQVLPASGKSLIVTPN